MGRHILKRTVVLIISRRNVMNIWLIILIAGITTAAFFWSE